MVILVLLVIVAIGVCCYFVIREHSKKQHKPREQHKPPEWLKIYRRMQADTLAHLSRSGTYAAIEEIMEEEKRKREEEARREKEEARKTISNFQLTVLDGSGNPRRNAAVEVCGNDGKYIGGGRTNEAGVFRSSYCRYSLTFDPSPPYLPLGSTTAFHLIL